MSANGPGDAVASMGQSGTLGQPAGFDDRGARWPRAGKVGRQDRPDLHDVGRTPGS